MTNVPATQEELPALVQELICGDDERAEQAALKIGLHGCEALAFLAPVLADPDPDRRWWATRALGPVKCEEARQRLIDGLCDPGTAPSNTRLSDQARIAGASDRQCEEGSDKA